MAITVVVDTGITTSSTEYSMVAGAAYNSGSTPSSTDGVYQLFVDTSDITAGDELQVRIYEKVRAADTHRIVYQANLVGPMVSGVVSNSVVAFPALVLMHNWDMTLDAISGTPDVSFTIKKVA